MNEKLYTPEEFSKLIGVGLSTLKTWRSRGEGPPYVKLGHLVRYSHKALVQYIEANEHDPAEGKRRR